MVHEELQQELAAYALGALDDVSARRVAAHLAEGCGTCSAEFRAWQAATDLLAYAPAPVRPSPAVKERLMKRIKEPTVAPMQPSEVRHRARVRPDWWGWAAAAALLVAFGITFGYALILKQRLGGAHAVITSLQDKQNQQQAVTDLLRAKDVRVVKLGSTENDLSSATVFWSPSRNRWVMVADGLPALPADKSYQLWFIVGDRTISGGVFSAADGVVQETLPTDLASVDAVAVSLEKAGGSGRPDRPEGKVKLVGKTS